MAGKLIVIDGGDAAGKKTQSELLVGWLMQEGYKTATLDFPQYRSFFGQLVGQYLRGELGKRESVNPRLAALLYAMDRSQFKETLQRWLAEDMLVVLDRYIESNLAYGRAKLDDTMAKDDLSRWIEELEYEKLGLPKADLVIYLHVPQDISHKLLMARKDKGYLKGGKADVHEADRAYQEQVVVEYLKLAQEHPHWQRIDCTLKGEMLKKEVIASAVQKAVSKLLGGPQETC